MHEDLRQRVVASVLTGAVALTLIAILIPLVSRRYVSQPLAELSRRLSLFSAEQEIHLEVPGNEVELLTEEFRRLYGGWRPPGSDWETNMNESWIWSANCGTPTSSPQSGFWRPVLPMRSARR